MNRIMKIILIVCAVVLVIAISGSMIYYYAFAKPKNERAILEWEKEKYQEEINQEKLKAIKEKLGKEERERQLYDCLDNAYENYNEAWDKQVERLDSKDGFLPGVTADNLNESYEKDKEECFKLYGSE